MHVCLPLGLLCSLIVYERVNFLSSLFTFCYFFLCSMHVIVHVLFTEPDIASCSPFQMEQGEANLDIA